MMTAIILPGWEHNVEDEGYTNIADMFRENDFEVLFYSPDWQEHDYQAWIAGLVKLTKDSQGPLTVLGFSMGAMTAFMASSDIDLENLILCSPSGYFSEYALLLSNEEKKWAEINVPDYDKLSAKKIVESCRVAHGYILAGRKELSDWPDFDKWTTDLQQMTNWVFIKIDDAGHEIEDLNYQNAIAQLVPKL
jgi:pimeloyl-ACP methyl ester carboxylesterase